jgi:hypothetical protein
MLKTLMISNMLFFSSSIRSIHQTSASRGHQVKHTKTETRSSTISSPSPLVAVHDTRSHELQKEIKRILEFIINASLLDSIVHSFGQRRVVVRVQEEARVVKTCVSKKIRLSPTTSLPSEFQESPYNVGYNFILLL